MCDAGCTAIFSETYIKIYSKKYQCISTGTRNLQNRLWYIQVDLFPAVVPGIQHDNGILKKRTTKKDIVRYHHRSVGSPTSNELLKGIKKVFLATFQGIDEKLVTKYLPPSIDTAKVHLQQERQGLKSIKLQSKPEVEDLYTLEVPTRTNLFVAAIVKATTGKVYGDLTGQYLTMSSSENQ